MKAGLDLSGWRMTVHGRNFTVIKLTEHGPEEFNYNFERYKEWIRSGRISFLKPSIPAPETQTGSERHNF